MTLPQQVPVSYAATIRCALPLPRLVSPLASVAELEVRSRALNTWTDISGASAFDLTDTTVSTAGVKGDATLAVVADAALVADAPYLVGGPTGQGQASDGMILRAERVDAAGELLTLPASQALPRAVAAGDLVLGWQVNAVLSAAQVGDYPGPIDIRGIVVTDSGETIPFWTVARSVYRMVRAPVTTSNVGALAPGAAHLARGSDLSLAYALETAWENAMGRLEAAGVNPWAVKDPDRLAQLHVAQLLRLFVDTDPKASPEFRREIQRQAEAEIDAAAGNVNLWLDNDPDADGDRAEDSPLLELGGLHLTRRG